ncbi:MAG: VTT domain-containing protein [Hyphomonadaceae bacterium]
MLTALKDRTVALARSRHAEGALFTISFAESSFFPLPPDLLLGPMAAAAPDKWVRYAITCTVASVLGGILGYGIGMFLMDSVGGWILNIFGYAGERREALEAQYAEYGLWVILIKGLTPIPYKLVTIVSGALHFSLPVFIAASIVTRGARFLLVAWLFQRFGPTVGPIIEKRLGLFLLGLAVLIVGGFVALQFLH